MAITVAVLINVSRPTNPLTAVSRAFDFSDSVNGSSPEPFQKKSSKRMSCSDECKLLTVFTSEMKWNEMNDDDQNADRVRQRERERKGERNKKKNKHRKMHHE